MEVTLDQLAEFERRATMAERERCALIAENYPIVAPSSEIVVQTTMEVAAVSIADEIRTGRTTETRSTISRKSPK